MNKKLRLSGLLLVILSLPAKSQPYVIANADFENTYGPLTFSSNGVNTWQIGTPNKPFFGTALTPPNAIMTDTLHPYPVNNQSSFILSNVDTLFMGFPYVHNLTTLTFEHKYQTTSGQDGGAIEVSYDDVHWQNFIADTVWRNNNQLGMLTPFNYNMYDTTNTLYNGTYGFSGTSNGWVSSTIQWQWYLAVERGNGTLPDSMFIRFTFYSDSIAESLDGWMIDNILLTGDDPGDVQQLYQSSLVTIYPQPSGDKANITIRKEIHPVEYYLFDLTGRMLQAGKATPAFGIDTHALDEGLYQLRILTDTNELLIKKILIAR